MSNTAISTKPEDAEVSPPERCHKGRCLWESGHAGSCLHENDSDSPKIKERIKLWRVRAITMMKARFGKIGRPSKSSQDATIAEIAVWCGVHPSTLYRWRAKEQKKQDAEQQASDNTEDDPAAAEKENHKKVVQAINSGTKAATWCAKLGAPDTIKVVQDIPEAKTRLVKLAATAAKQLEPVLALEMHPEPVSAVPSEVPPTPSLASAPDLGKKLTLYAQWMAGIAKLALNGAHTLAALVAQYAPTGDLNVIEEALGVVEDECRERIEEAEKILDKAGDDLQGRLDEGWNKDGKAASQTH